MLRLTLLSSIILVVGIGCVVKRYLVNQHKKIFSSSASSSIEDDEIYPVHFIDQAAVIRSSLISYTFRYAHVLDAQQLRDALVNLLGSGQWRKLGGRLRRSVSAKIKYLSFTFIHLSYADLTPIERREVGNPCPTTVQQRPSAHPILPPRVRHGNGCSPARETSSVQDGQKTLHPEGLPRIPLLQHSIDAPQQYKSLPLH